MTQDMSALVFDAFGTLFDVHSVARIAEEALGVRPDAVVRDLGEPAALPA